MTITSVLSLALVNLCDLIDVRAKSTPEEPSKFLRNDGTRPRNDGPGSSGCHLQIINTTLSTRSHAATVYGKDKPTSRRTRTRCMARMKRRDWLNFAFVALATFNDYFDLYIVSIAIWKLATYYRSSYSNISSALTFSLLARSTGALMFGAAGSSSSSTLTRRWGQRATLSLTCMIMGGVHIISIHTTKVEAFFLTRGVMGMEIGSMWGSVAHDVVEACPPEAQPVLYTLLDVLGSLAFIVVALINWQTGGKADTWKTLFWIAAGLSFTTAFVRLVVPEQHKQGVAVVSSSSSSSSSSSPSIEASERLSFRSRIQRYFQDSAASSRRALRLGWTMFRTEWRTMAYMTVFAALQAYAQNILVLTYMAFLRRGKMLHNGRASVVCMIARSGAVVGSIVGAGCATRLGVRRTIVVFGLLACFLTPAAMLPDAVVGLCAGGFFVHFALFAALAAIPTHFRAIAPQPYANIMPLVVYHAGTSLASPATQLAHVLTANFHTHVVMRGSVYVVSAYTTIMLITISSFSLAWALWTAIGPDNASVNTTDQQDRAHVVSQRGDETQSYVQHEILRATPRRNDIESLPPQLSPQQALSPLLYPSHFSPETHQHRVVDEIIAAPMAARMLDYSRSDCNVAMIQP